MRKITIAIDGPGAAGKSTVAKEVAKRLNYTYFDTGAMYRCLALYALRNNIDIFDENALAEAIPNLNIKLTNTGNVYLNNEDVSNLIRTIEVTKVVSEVSTPIKVRKLFVSLQQKMASKTEGVVMDGRDIGTVVLPDADLKIFQVANSDVRANRRYLENLDKGITTPLNEIKSEIERRDYLDTHKAFGALIKADDAIEMDTSYMSINENVEAIIALAKEKTHE